MRKCELCGSNDRVYLTGKWKYLCHKHSNSYYRRGEIIEVLYDKKNEVVYYDDYAEIILYDAYENKKSVTKVDNDLLPVLKKYRWTYQGGRVPYVATTIKRRTIKLHQIVIGIKPGYVIDHINHDSLDNRRINLRHLTNGENIRNNNGFKNNTSGYRNIFWDKRTKSWSVRIWVKGKAVWLGRHASLKKAIVVRDDFMKHSVHWQVS